MSCLFVSLTKSFKYYNLHQEITAFSFKRGTLFANRILQVLTNALTFLTFTTSDDLALFKNHQIYIVDFHVPRSAILPMNLTGLLSTFNL